MSPFRDRLKAAAKHAGVEYGQTAIARSLGVSKQTVDLWMDEGRPTAETIYLIADKWNVDPRWLQIEEGEMVPPPLDEKLKPGKKRILSDGEKLLVLLRAFLDTDSEGKDELVFAAKAVSRQNAAIPTAKRAKRR